MYFSNQFEFCWLQPMPYQQFFLAINFGELEVVSYSSLFRNPYCMTSKLEFMNMFFNNILDKIHYKQLFCYNWSDLSLNRGSLTVIVSHSPKILNFKVQLIIHVARQRLQIWPRDSQNASFNTMTLKCSKRWKKEKVVESTDIMQEWYVFIYMVSKYEM